MIRDAGSKFDDYSISPKIRQILLHWGYELTEFSFYWFDKLMYKKLVTNGLTEMKSYTKQNKDILKKRLLSITHETEKQ